MHPALQARSPGAQLHRPEMQRPPVGQALPQVPQLAGSAVGSTHCPAQSTEPAGHTQAPASQLCPPLQAAPHAPQFRASLARSTQLKPHAVNGGAQPDTQVAAWQ
jgi:hypothetical protein